MKIKSAKSFRNWFKTKVNEIDDSDKTHNEDFVGTYYKQKGQKTINGFFKMYHGHTPDIAGYLPSILKIAEDGQAIYEFLQNAVDCGSTHFYIFYNEKYFLAINNGSPFDINGLESILNIAQTTKKDPDKIGRFGIGFKLAHRLVGKNEGTEELVQQYKGPILFSWSKLSDLESLLNNDPIENLMPNQENNEEFDTSPYLLKILLTNFPSDPEEKVRDLNYNEKTLFPKEELNELIDFLNENFQLHADSLNKNVLQQGSMFFIKLGEDKKRLLDKDYSELVDGIQYSMNTLKNLEKVYINSEDIEKTFLQLEEGLISRDSDEFKIISPEYKEFDIKFAIGFPILNFGNPQSYEQIKLLREKPNFYKYFPMGDEVNGLGFIVHCDSFSNEANRRKLHEDEINRNLFPEISKFICQKLTYYQQNDRNKYLNLYASILLSDIPERQNNKWLKPIFYDYLLNYLKENIPTTANFSNEAKKVKINKLNLQLKLSDFGLDDIVWFQWSSKDDQLLIEEALKPEKLGLKVWDIKDIIENADLDRINTWIKNTNDETYNSFLREIEKSSYLRDDTKNRLLDIKLFEFSDGNFYSVNDINQSIIFNTDKTSNISNELQKLGFVVSLENIKTYEKIYNALVDKLPKEKDIYNAIAEKCKTNTLSAEEKKKLFLNFINNNTKFDNVANDTLKDLKLFCNSNSQIKPLNRLIHFELNTASWLNPYKIKSDEFFTELKTYLVSEQEDIFNVIYLPNQEIIISGLTEANEIKSLIKLYQSNQNQFFKKFIIKKTEHSFSIVEKTSNTFQVQSADKEARNFIDKYCSDKLFVLPYDFLEFKEEDGIVKNNELYINIIDCVEVDELQEELITIISKHYVSYQAKLKFLNTLPEIKFVAGSQYNNDSVEYKILDLACQVLKESQQISKLREKIIVESNGKNFKPSKILPTVDKIKIATKEFSLSKILPSTHQNNNLISDLILQFEGIPREKLNALFGVSEEPELSIIFEMFSEQVEILENPEQFFFLLYYHQDNPKVDLSKLGFDIECAVYPSEFALENEKLPEYLQQWINNEEIKLPELEKLGIWTENTVLVELRKFLKGEINEFSNVRLAQDTRFNKDETMLFNTFEWLKEKSIKLSAPEQFESLKKIVDIINESRKSKGDLIIQEEYNFELLMENSTIWQETENFSIHLYNGEMPKTVGLDEIKDYIFYNYNNDDFAVNENSIYVNENTDIEKTLQKVASDDNNDFSFKELWKLFKGDDDNTNEDNQETNTTFLDEVNQFIAEELEDTEWSDYIPDLKNLLQDFNNHPQEKQKLFNLIAKIKLAKERNIKYEDSDEGFNVVKIGDEKYFVHSARGAFAYIHPNEILKMINEGYKMALDFNTKSRIKIYDKAEDILELNTNHILAFQGDKPFEDLIAFCEANRGEKKHLLIIDKDNANEKSKAYLKLFNNSEDDYQ